MKILDIALKDMTSAFRSAFALLFMFVIPLLIPLMFLAMFGSMQQDEQAFALPVTKVVVVNLDEGGAGLEQAMASLPQGTQAGSLGGLIVSVLKDPSFAALLEVRIETDPETARALVDNQAAGVALIIPEDFSARYASMDGQAVLQFYQDPTLSIGPGIVRSILNQFMDGLSGARIAVEVTMAQTGSSDPALIGQVVSRYVASQPQGDPTAALLDLRAPAAAPENDNLMLRILAPMMGAMMIFYAYYTGVSMAQGILQEDEARTLSRLFTTPTRPAAILTGKFVSVFLTVTVQVLILVLASTLIFRIDWGSPPAVALLIVCTILSASCFGIFLNSLLKSTKQGGVIFGGVLTLTTMTAMLPIFTGFAGPSPAWATNVSLLMPQGWVIRLLLDSMNGVQPGGLLPTVLVSLAWTVVFFVAGVWRFQRRYA